MPSQPHTRRAMGSVTATTTTTLPPTQEDVRPVMDPLQNPDDPNPTPPQVTNQPGDDEDEEPDEETLAILNARIAKSTRRRYNCNNIHLLLFLFDEAVKYPNILNPDLMVQLLHAHEQDAQCRTASGCPSKQRASMRKVILSWLLEIDPKRTETLPINFEYFSFKAYAAFLKTFKETVTTKHQLAPTEVPDSGETVIVTNKVTIRLSVGSFSNACSAFSHLFLECNVDKSPTRASRFLWKKLSIYLKGTRRTGARERQEHGIHVTEGKDPMKFKAYVELAKILCKSDDREHIAAHLFLLLDWNMVSRAEGVVSQHIDLFGIYKDALLVRMGPSKGDQDGTKHTEHRWHIYLFHRNLPFALSWHSQNI